MTNELSTGMKLAIYGLPRFFQRKDNGEVLERNPDNSYSYISSKDNNHTYSYSNLKLDFKDKFEPIWSER